MPNIKSAKKRVKVATKKMEANRAVRTELKTVVKKARAEGAVDATILTAVKKLDKAASKGIIHKNKAARLKSQFAKKQNKAVA